MIDSVCSESLSWLTDFDPQCNDLFDKDLLDSDCDRQKGK